MFEARNPEMEMKGFQQSEETKELALATRDFGLFRRKFWKKPTVMVGWGVAHYVSEKLPSRKTNNGALGNEGFILQNT